MTKKFISWHCQRHMSSYILHETFDHARGRRSPWPAALHHILQWHAQCTVNQKVPSCSNVGAAGIRVGVTACQTTAPGRPTEPPHCRCPPGPPPRRCPPCRPRPVPPWHPWGFPLSPSSACPPGTSGRWDPGCSQNRKMKRHGDKRVQCFHTAPVNHIGPAGHTRWWRLFLRVVG